MRYILIVILSGMFSAGAYAAADSSGVKKPSLTLAAIYGRNASYYGQTTAERLPYILTNASFRMPGGFYLSGSAYRLLNMGGSGISAMDASAGFNWDLGADLTAGIGYTRSFYPENSPLLQAGNNNTASASIGYDWQIFETDLDGDYSFGAEQDVFVSLSNSKWINLGGIGRDEGYFTLEPSVEVVGGTRHYLEEYTIRKSRRDQVQDWIRNPLFPPGQDKTETATSSRTTFDLMSCNFSLPIGYNRGNYLLEAGYQVSVPGKKISPDSRGMHSFFNLSFYYQF